MVPNQKLEARLMASLAALAMTVTAGCSSFHSHRHATSAEEPAEAQTAPADEEQTATEAAISESAGASTEAAAPPPPPAESSQSTAASDASSIVNPTAPKRYTVKRGDTLWDIASLFLKDPWLWPEVWYINPKIENPHLIYPGDVLTLGYTGPGGAPQVRLESGGPARLHPRLRSSPLDAPIPTLPYSAIAGFLSRPTMLAKDEIKRAPHVLALRDRHVIGGAGDDVYVRGLKDVPVNARYNVIHVADPIRDPDNGRVLGYQGVYSATALLTKPGDPAKAQLVDSARETLQGDRLFAMDAQVPLSFELRAPQENIAGRIISVVDGVQLIGQYQIVAINRGTRHGLAPGHILAIDQAGEVVRDRYTGIQHRRLHVGSPFAPRVRLPNERAGTLLVFKTYDRMSFGLVVGAATTMKVADIVRTP